VIARLSQLNSHQVELPAESALNMAVAAAADPFRPRPVGVLVGMGVGRRTGVALLMAACVGLAPGS